MRRPRDARPVLEWPQDRSAGSASPHRPFYPIRVVFSTLSGAPLSVRGVSSVEADLFRTLLAESPGATLAALLCDSPAAKLLARTQRQIAAFERTWYRAHTELHRACRQSEAAGEQSFDRYLDRLCERPPITELASILFPPVTAVPDSPAVLTIPAESRSLETPRAS